MADPLVRAGFDGQRGDNADGSPHTSGQAYLYCATLSQLFHETAWL